MRRVLFALAVAASAVACGPRRVEVSAAEAGPAAAQLTVTNTLSQPVNVYVVSEGTETFVRQIGANVTETVPVRGIAGGSTVTLRATPVDGRNTYTRPNVVLSGTYNWQVP